MDCSSTDAEQFCQGPKKGYRDHPIIKAPLGKIISAPSFLVSKDAIFSELL